MDNPARRALMESGPTGFGTKSRGKGEGHLSKNAGRAWSGSCGGRGGRQPGHFAACHCWTVAASAVRSCSSGSESGPRQRLRARQRTAAAHARAAATPKAFAGKALHHAPPAPPEQQDRYPAEVCRTSTGRGARTSFPGMSAAEQSGLSVLVMQIISVFSCERSRQRRYLSRHEDSENTQGNGGVFSCEAPATPTHTRPHATARPAITLWVGGDGWSPSAWAGGGGGRRRPGGPNGRCTAPAPASLRRLASLPAGRGLLRIAVEKRS